MPKWRCEKCNHIHSSNPTKCEECGHAILQQYRGASPSDPSETNGSTESSTLVDVLTLVAILGLIGVTLWVAVQVV
jgi:rubredoxin